MLKPEEIQYILENEGAETSRLLLGRHPAGINVPLCVKCIEARKKMKIKAPLWHSFPSLVYPFSVSVEQGSSQATALFKQQLILEHLRPSTGSTSTNGGTFVDETKISGSTSTNGGAFVDETNISSSTSTNMGAIVDETNISGNTSTNGGAFVDETNISGSTSTNGVTFVDETNISGSTSTNGVTFVDGTDISGSTSTNGVTFVDETNISSSTSTNGGAFVDGKQNLSGRARGIITADLTGGMGIDSFFISRIAEKHYYFERNTELCEATAYNFGQLSAENIIVSNRDITADGCAALEELKGQGIDLLYIDPARRLADGKKAILLQDYEPNVVDLQEKMFEVSPNILVKVSPMADISLNLKLLPKTSAVYVVTVDNECKELLFLLNRDHEGIPNIHVAILYNKLNINNIQNKESECTTNLKSEISDFELIVQKCDVTEKGIATYTSQVKSYLYELGKGWLKAGAFNLVSQRFNCEKLAASTHLYTSDEQINEFPGKAYKVEEVIPFNKKSLKELAKRFPKADITARNFPLDTNALKKLSGIKDGGDRHIFATTLHNGDKVVIVTNPTR